MMAAAAIVFAGCEDKLIEPEDPNQEQEEPTPDPEPVAGEIKLDGEASLTFSCEGGSQNVSFEATLEWTAAADEDFVTVGPAAGEAGEARVTIAVDENTTYDARTATVTLTCGEDVKTIQVTQKQVGALFITEKNYPVAAEGGVVTVVAQASFAVEVEIEEAAQAWIVRSVTPSALEDYTFQFEVAANESEDPRTAQIVFSTETGSETVTISQAGAEPKPFVSGFAVDGAAPFKTLWANGDAVAVNGVTSDALVVDAAVATADFVVRAELEAPFNALYPASVLKAETVDVVTLPAQAYVAEVAAEAVLPMAAQAQDRALAFNQLCSVVKFTVTSEEAYTLDYAVLTASDKLHGEFTVDYSTATLAASEATDAEKTMRCEVDNALTAEGVNLYFVVPAAEYASLSLNLVDVEGMSMTYTTEALAAAAGTVTEVDAFEFKPEQFSIATASDFVNFATKYNAKKLDTNVKVTLTDDITFDEETSAAFAATGGIGVKISDEETYYFNGAFDGNGKTIKGYVSSIPLFAYTGDGGEITNVHFDNTCQLKVNAGATDTYHGILVGRHKGLVENCTSAASVVINNLEDVSTATQYYGGLVGRNYGGTVENSVVTGDITCTQAGITVSTNNVSVGGVAGGLAEGGLMSNCTFTGNVVISDGTEYGGITADGLYFYVGGIVGYVDKGKVTDCFSGAESATTIIDVRGTCVPSIGGIASWVKTVESEISNCANYMLMSFASNGGRKVTSPCRVGGIVSRSAAAISGCNNYGAISTICNSTSVYLAGIVGDGMSASNCINHETATITRTSELMTAQGNRYMYIGGIMATNNAVGTIDQCSNKASLLNNATGLSTATTVDVSGILACAQNQVAITKCSNMGAITAKDAVNKVVTARITAAGILGYCPAELTTIHECENSGKVFCDYSTGGKTNKRRSYIGGIAGLIASQTMDENSSPIDVLGVRDIKVTNCSNTGFVDTHNYNNQAKSLLSSSFSAGIVGAIKGTEEGKAIVKNNTSNGEYYNYRGISGGVAGYVEWASFDNNTVFQNMGGNASSEVNAGVVGWILNSTMDNCSYSGEMSGSNYVSGLIGFADANTTITNCKVDGAKITKGASPAAVLVNTAASGITITNCGVKGTLDGAEITLESTMIAVDGGAIVTGTYLLD